MHVYVGNTMSPLPDPLGMGGGGEVLSDGYASGGQNFKRQKIKMA